MTKNKLSGGNIKDRITIKFLRSIEFIEIESIIRVESARAYAILFVKGEESKIISFPLKKMEQKLSKYSVFFRCHKSHLINLMHVKSYHSDKGIILSDNSIIPLAPDMKIVFIKKMEKLFGPASE